MLLVFYDNHQIINDKSSNLFLIYQDIVCGNFYPYILICIKIYLFNKMLTIEQLNSLTDLREKFQAVTGLTWDPTTIDDEELLKTIQWYFPKGAGFDKEHIAFDKGVIEALHGDASDPYYNEGEGGEHDDDDKDVPQDEKLETLNITGKTLEDLNALGEPYGISGEEISAADTDNDGKVEIVSKPAQDEEGNYMVDSEGKYTTVYAVQNDTED